jgi:hypothetical protein
MLAEVESWRGDSAELHPRGVAERVTSTVEALFNQPKVVAAVENTLDCDSNMYVLSPQADRRVPKLASLSLRRRNSRHVAGGVPRPLRLRHLTGVVHCGRRRVNARDQGDRA